jgi:cellobiose phosphorylase
LLGKAGGVFFLTSDTVAPDDAVLLAAAARAAFGGGRGSLTEQIDRPGTPPRPSFPQPLTPAADATNPVAEASGPPEGLRFWNGFGGFTRDGREYVIVTDSTSRLGPKLPPAPWTNVLANPRFGCLVTEAGRLQLGRQQSNESPHPLVERSGSGPSGEVIYLRDEETGDFWTPTPLPLGPRATVTIHHGQGYTRYTHVSRDIHQDLVVFVPTDDPIKLVCLTVRNSGERLRRLTATYYAEWVLGTVRENAPLQVVCERDPESSAILARNAWAGAFARRSLS